MKMESKFLYLLEERIKTFKDWPFDNTKKCNINNMAEAGFYSVATCKDDIDAAKCFLCGKELDGWEPDDDPWLEHKSHAAKCAFVQIGKKENELLLTEFLSIAKQYMLNEIKIKTETAKEIIEERSNKIVRRKRWSRNKGVSSQ